MRIKFSFIVDNLYIFFLFSSLIFFDCHSSTNEKGLRDYVYKMKKLEVDEDKTTAGVSESHEEGDFTVSKTPFTSNITVEELAGFNPNIGVIWPGALVQGSSLISGTLAPINVKRSEINLLLSTLGQPYNELNPTDLHVINPSAGNVERARVKLMQKGFIIPAKLSQTYKQFYSLEHAMTQIGANISYLGSNLKAQLQSENYASQSNIVVSFAQEYYTIVVEPLTSPTSFFGEKINIDDITPYSDTLNNPITYIQSVTYGRLGLLLSSSKETFSDLKKSLDAYVSWASGSASAHYGDEEQKILKQSEVKLLLFGGSPDKSIKLIPTTAEALDALNIWLKQDIKPKDIQLGLPISYRVNYLKDNTIARLSFTTNYERVEYHSIPQLNNWSITFHTHDDDLDDDTGVYVGVNGPNGLIANWSKSDKSRYENGSTKDFNLTPNTKLFLQDKDNASIYIKISPNGDDEWDFSYELTANITSGGTFTKHGSMRLSDRHKEETQSIK